MSKINPVPIGELLGALYQKFPPYQILSDLLQAQIATAIASARIERNMNQKQFAEFMEVTQSQVSKWENGDSNFTIEKLCQIADKLDMELSVTLRNRRPRINKIKDNVVYLSFSSTASSTASPWSSGRGYISEDELKEM